MAYLPYLRVLTLVGIPVAGGFAAIVPKTGTLTAVRMIVTVASAVGSVTGQLTKNGSNVASTSLTATQGSTTTQQATGLSAALAAGDLLAFPFSSLGSAALVTIQLEIQE